MEVKLEGDGAGGFNTLSRGSSKDSRRPRDDTERGQWWWCDVTRRRASNLAATVARARAMLRRGKQKCRRVLDLYRLQD